MNRFKFRAKAFMAIVLFTLCVRHLAQALPGDLDTSFDGDGKVITDFRSSGFSGVGISSVRIQADHKIIVGGSASGSASSGVSDFFLARYNPGGSLDATFGTGGKVITSFTTGSFFDDIADLAIQTDGKIVAVGEAGEGQFALARYNSNGSLDTTFGTGGKVAIQISTGSDKARAVAIQPDGKIVVAGTALSANFGLARFNANGALDTTFGNGGKVVNFGNGDEDATDVAIQADGRILTTSAHIIATPGGALTSVFDIIRFNANGTLDNTFDGDGRVSTAFSGSAFALRMVIQPDQKIVVAGSVASFPTDRLGIARYNPDGSLDATFGNGGKVEIDSQGAIAVALQADGKILTLGGGGLAGITLTRFSSFGLRDATFADNGRVHVTFGSDLVNIGALAIQNNDGRIVLAGTDHVAPNSGKQFAALARYHACQCGGQNVTILGTAGPDTLNGTLGPDVIDGLGGDDIIHGGTGDDIICGGDGNDSLFGDSGSDTLFGNAGINTLDGGVGPFGKPNVDSGIDIGVGGAGDTFVSCEAINRGGGGVSGVWEDVSQRCHGAGPGLRCRLKGTIAVENPATETTAVPFVTAFYLSADDILDENDIFLGTVKVRALEGGKSKKVKLNVKLDAGQNVSGQHIISVLDFFDAVPEVNEANNILSSPQVQ